MGDSLVGEMGTDFKHVLFGVIEERWKRGARPCRAVSA